MNRPFSPLRGRFVFLPTLTWFPNRRVDVILLAPLRGYEEEPVKTLGILNILCGLVLSTVVAFEAATTGTVRFPIMCLLGPGFLFAGILDVARSRRRER